MARFLCKMFTLFFLCVATFAKAEENPFGITFYGSFIHTNKVSNALFFFNEIKKRDSFELRRALRNHKIDTVVLASNGGSVWEGLNMAGIIYDKGIITYVPKLPDDLGCRSACSFMFFAGKIRKVDGILAVHQAGSYGSERDKTKEQVSDTQQVTQYTVSEIIGFLNEFETPPWVYEKMFRSREFYEFNDDEKRRLASRTEDISSESLTQINHFIDNFFSYLDDLEEEKTVKENDRELTEKEIRLVVMEFQKLLNAAGCDAGPVDGIWGRRTQAAAVLFAKTANLPTSPEDLASDEFYEKLSGATKGFCPQAKKTYPTGKFYGFEHWRGKCWNGWPQCPAASKFEKIAVEVEIAKECPVFKGHKLSFGTTVLTSDNRSIKVCSY